MSFVTNNYILIKLIKSNEKLDSIVLPEKALDKPQWGYVLDCGEGLSDIYGNVFPPQFEAGELVYFMKHGPEKVDYSDVGLPEDLYIISEGDVYIKLKPSADGDVDIIPIGNFVHIEPLEDTVQKVSAGGIILPERAVQRPTKARVLSVGQGQRTVGGKYHAPRVRPGDIVRYRPHSTYKISFNDLGVNSEQHIVAYGDIVAVETEGFKEYIQEKLTHVKPLPR